MMQTLKTIGIVVLAIALFLSVIQPQQKVEASLMESFSIKVTVIENGIEHEWEYHSPSEYEYEKGERVIKNEKAKAEVEKIVELLKLSEDANVEDMVKALKGNGFNNIERLDVRWMNGDSQLFTWVWEKDVDE